MKSDSQKVVYYSDPLNNDFAGTDIKQKKIKDNYVFIHKNPLWYILEFVVYRIIATPLVTVFMKVAYGLKIKNRKVLRECKNQGYFLYGNHTSILSDAYAPTIISFIRKAFIIVNPDAISIPVIGHVIQMLGGIPLPTSYAPMKNYMQAISTHIKTKQSIMIYPEAHLWPYCTFIRPFLHTPKITICWTLQINEWQVRPRRVHGKNGEHVARCYSEAWKIMLLFQPERKNAFILLRLVKPVY